MSLDVTMRIFSGTPDPQWPLPAAVEKRLQPWLATQAAAMISADKLRAFEPEEPTGYLGFFVHNIGVVGDTKFVPAGTIGQVNDVEKGVIMARIDKVLFDSIPLRLQKELGLGPRSIELRAALPIANLPDLSTRPMPQCGVTSYQAIRSRWNMHEFITHNRCYAYAANVLMQNARALPLETPPNDHQWSAAELIAAATADAFDSHQNVLPQTCPLEHGHYVVACLGGDPPFNDYHFFRLDADGTWSHKAGDRRATNKDDLGQRIINLNQAQFREPYTFCSFFAVTRRVRSALCTRLRPIEGPCPDSDCREPECDEPSKKKKKKKTTKKPRRRASSGKK